MTGFEGYEELSRKLEVLSKMADIVERDLSHELSNEMRNTAVRKLSQPSGLPNKKTGQLKPAVDSGTLRNSIQSKESEFVLRTSETTVECGIQTAVEYAPFIEYGTGPLGDPEVAHTSKMSWAYMGTDGKLHFARSQPARPFMRPALYENREVFKDIIYGKIRELFD